MATIAAEFFASHRIVISRFAALAFFVLLVSFESAQEGTLLSAVLFLTGLILVGIATAGRLWCALYISGHKNRELVTDGPYSMTRNPLYFFSLLGFAGIGFATETFSFAIGCIVFFALVYPSVIAHEEHLLRSRFGQAFVAYCVRTPRFFPNLRLFREPDSYVVDPKVFRRAIGDVLWFIWLVGIVEFVEALHEYHIVEPLIRLP